MSHNYAFFEVGTVRARTASDMSPLAVSLALAIAMALTAGAAFLYLRMTSNDSLQRNDGVFPQAGGFEKKRVEPKLIETECSATYVPVDGPDFTGSFPPPNLSARGEATRDIRRGQSPELDLLAAEDDLEDADSSHPTFEQIAVTRELRLIDTGDTLFERVVVGHQGLSAGSGQDDADLEAPTDRYAKPVKSRAVHTIPRTLVDS